MEYYILTIDPNFVPAMHYIGHKKDRAEGMFKAYKRMGHGYIVMFEVDRINDYYKPLATCSGSEFRNSISSEDIKDFSIRVEAV